MSTAALPGVTLTGNEALDNEKLAENAALKALEEYRKTHPETRTSEEQPTAKPIKVKIGNTEHEFVDEGALSTALAQTLSAYEAKLAELGQRPAPAPKKEPKDEFLMEEFAKLVEKNPLEGIEYAFGHSRFNKELEELRNFRNQQTQQTAAYQFREIARDFTPEPQNLTALQQAVSNLGLNPADPRHLKAAWSFAKESGAVPAAQGNMQYKPAPPTAPPMLGRSSNDPVPNWALQAENLDEASLEALINKIQRGG